MIESDPIPGTKPGGFWGEQLELGDQQDTGGYRVSHGEPQGARRAISCSSE